ncbi:hypothetical protein A9X06_23595 [Mycobacterium sp. 852002-51759_SCH5129042]|nr:hypothetical protein A9X06_23595 [Mycobacterium sp. 852002-51759_SCH5129042]
MTPNSHNGSVEILNPSVRCGFSSNRRQILPTVDFDSPVRSAIDDRDQCVASDGACSKVISTTCCT